jgi:hypothetical protein
MEIIMEYGPLINHSNVNTLLKQGDYIMYDGRLGVVIEDPNYTLGLRCSHRGINREAASMTVEEIYGSRKAELIARAQADVQKFFAPFGLNVEQLYWASPVRVPDAVMHQINQKIANEQQALAAQANVATAEANARAKVAEAEGRAKAMQVEANAISTNPQILQLRAIEKWDGHYPHYVGGGMPLPTLGVGKN